MREGAWDGLFLWNGILLVIIGVMVELRRFFCDVPFASFGDFFSCGWLLGDVGSRGGLAVEAFSVLAKSEKFIWWETFFFD